MSFPKLREKRGPNWYDVGFTLDRPGRARVGTFKGSGYFVVDRDVVQLRSGLFHLIVEEDRCSNIVDAEAFTVLRAINVRLTFADGAQWAIGPRRKQAEPTLDALRSTGVAIRDERRS